MQKESKTLAWISVVLLNIIAILVIMVSDTYLLTDILTNPLHFLDDYIFVILAVAALTILPTFVSYIKGGWKKYITYGVPALATVSIIAGFIQQHTCTGKMCGLLGVLIMFVGATVLVFFPLNYGLAQYAAPKRNFWMYLVLTIECLAICGLIAYLFYITHYTTLY